MDEKETSSLGGGGGGSYVKPGGCFKSSTQEHEYRHFVPKGDWQGEAFYCIYCLKVKHIKV